MSASALGLYDADGRPVYDLLLSIRLPGRPELQGPARVGVRREQEHWLRAGAVLPIKADRTRPFGVAVDWDALAPAR